MFYYLWPDKFVSSVHESTIMRNMYKLVILIEPLENENAFDEQWPAFLAQAEAIPGLVREASGRVETMLFGQAVYARQHELYFNSMEEARVGLASPHGRVAGRLLQSMTGGRMVLFFVEHHEDSAENLARVRQARHD